MKAIDQQNKKSESGFITLDFIFALTIAMSFVLIFIGVSLTLSMVEVSQYIVYATSRAYSGAHQTKQQQTDLANAKFNELMGQPAFKTMFSSGWFTLGKPVLDDFSNEYPELPENDNNIFVGAQAKFTAQILDMHLPLVGNTMSDQTTGVATLNSYLLREVSTAECVTNFNMQRFTKLKLLDNRYAKTPSTATAAIITDNGC